MTTSHIIKISANSFREFSSMIDTCDGNSEDDTWFGLWTALSNSTCTSKGYQSPRLATLNQEQVIKLRQWIGDHIYYLLNVTIGQLNDDRQYQEANAVRYTVKGLRSLDQKLNFDTPTD